MRLTTGFALWLIAAAAATLVGMFAVGAIGADIFGPDQQEPLSQSEVDRQLAESSTGPTSPTTTDPPSSTTTTTTPPATSKPAPPPATSKPRPPAAQPTVIPSAGGTVFARCAQGGLVEVIQSVPAQGFQIHSSDDGLDDHPSIKFRSGDREVEIRLRCRGGQLTNEIKDD
jgi:hypothetical protein